MSPRTGTASATAMAGRTSTDGRSESSTTSPRQRQKPRPDDSSRNKNNSTGAAKKFTAPFLFRVKVNGIWLSQAGVDIELRKSALDFVFVRRLIKSSMASTVESGLNTLRNTHTRLSSSGGSSNSSLRVPER